MTEVQILSSPPISGTIDEFRFEAIGNCTWVKFIDDTYEEWCGIFGHGFYVNSNDAIVNDNGQAFIISGGQGYIVDVNSRNPLYKTDNDYLTSVVYIPESEFFISCSFTNLFAYSPQGLMWESDRISVDGIKFLEFDNKMVKGQVWNTQDWVDFTLVVNGWKYQSKFKCDF